MQFTVKKYKEKVALEMKTLRQALGIETKKCPVISVVGAGGKTTLITRLAQEYRKSHIPVIVTTTTHMRMENKPWFLLEPSLEKLDRIMKSEGMVWIGIPDENEKMKAPSQEFLREVLHLEYPLLIEADGAKLLPLKVPAKHEPVILPETTHVLNVYGLDALGEPLNEVCFRGEIAAEFLQKGITDMVMKEDIVKLALSQICGKKGSTMSMEYHVVLNKADSEKRQAEALAICRLAEKQGFNRFLITTQGKAER